MAGLQVFFLTASAIAGRLAPANTDCTKQISIDCAAQGSPLRYRYGTNRGPLCQGSPPFNVTHVPNAGIDVSDDLHGMGATLIRTHGAEEMNWEKMFPHPTALLLDHSDPPIDTADPSNYDFLAADLFMQRILDHGFEPYVRLGGFEFDAGGALPPPRVPRYNASALVDVMLHIVMHFNDGWGGGNFTKRSCRYWEIWNEPDSSCSHHAQEGCGQFWNRSATDFYDLFDGIARVLKEYDPSLIVGGPGAALPDEAPGTPWPASVPNPYSFGLIDAIAARSTPVDFFSWHFYSDESALLSKEANAMQAKLAEVGLAHVTQHVSEWFTGMLNPSQDSVHDAAAVAAIMVQQIHSGVSAAMLYPACDDGEGKTGGKGWGLFDQASESGQARWRPLTHTYAMVGQLVQRADTTVPAVVAQSAESDTFAVLAARAFVASSHTLHVIVASQNSSCTSVSVRLNGLPAASAPMVAVEDQPADNCSVWRYTVSVVDAANLSPSNRASGVSSASAAGELDLNFELVSPAVALVTLEMI